MTLEDRIDEWISQITEVISENIDIKDDFKINILIITRQLLNLVKT